MPRQGRIFCQGDQAGAVACLVSSDGGFHLGGETCNPSQTAWH